jgi:hypothetical protein
VKLQKKIKKFFRIMIKEERMKKLKKKISTLVDKSLTPLHECKMCGKTRMIRHIKFCKRKPLFQIDEDSVREELEREIKKRKSSIMTHIENTLNDKASFPLSINDSFYPKDHCPICLKGKAVKVTVCINKHSFCFGCMENHFRCNVDVTQCPYCREVRVSFILAKIFYQRF